MKKKVLICDDDEGIVDVTQIILEEKGYEVVVCDEADSILETLKVHMPDLVLLDLWMPNKNGEEILMIIKESNIYKHIPVIIISASKDTEKIAKRSHADDFLNKPFDIKDLEDMVEKYTNYPSD